MSCGASIGEYDGPTASVYREQMLKARKPHKCYECRDAIPIGAVYERVVGVWEGRWASYSFCAACSEISKEFSEGSRTFGYVWEGMRESWAYGSNLQSCLNRLTSVAAKTKLRDEWLKDKGLAK